MKRIAIILIMLSAMAACKKGPAVVDGSILSYSGQKLTYLLSSDPVEHGELEVSEDGTFHMEKTLDEPCPINISLLRKGSTSILLIPGESYKVSVDADSNPAQWTVENNCPTESAYYEYYKNEFGKLDYVHYAFPETFAEYAAMWDERLEQASEQLKKVKSASVRKYLKESTEVTAIFNKFNYAWQMQKRGVSFDSDPDFMAFYNSIDLSNRRVCKTMLRNMITVKEQCYCDTIAPAVRHIMAVDELCPTAELRDSLARTYVVSTIKDSKINSKYEGEYLLAKASELISDEAELQSYRDIVDKAVTLLRGNPAIDFRMTDVKGKSIMLSDLKGKVVYVDFWATWCIPCCLQIPYLKEIAKKYASNPEVICVSVSLDKDLAAWKSFLASDTATWPQYVADNAGRDIMADYGFRAIPRFMLFDQSGNIVSTNAPRPQDAAAVTALIDSLL